jgi:ribosomal protein S18 acetylase RimI-like enzyme
VAPLLFASSPHLYERYAGGREQALRFIVRAFERLGTTASEEVVTVAELDGRVRGVMAAFPALEARPRANTFLSLTLRAIPPWRWPGALGIFLSAARVVPAPPSGALYVDALATDPRFRRRGIARALLEAAERHARAEGLTSVALDTALANAPARALYAAAGFEEVATSAVERGGVSGYVALLKRLG